MSGNPYLDAFRALPSDFQRRGEPLVEFGESSRGEAYAEARKRICSRFAWSVPTDAAIDMILQYADRIFDWGSGPGYWASLLATRGATVRCFDVEEQADPWHPVSQTGSPQPTEALMIGWPIRGRTDAAYAVNGYSGDTIIYVGELLRGCGEPQLFCLLMENWELVDMCPLPQWWNRSDKLYIWKRATERPS